MYLFKNHNLCASENSTKNLPAGVYIHFNAVSHEHNPGFTVQANVVALLHSFLKLVGVSFVTSALRGMKCFKHMKGQRLKTGHGRALGEM